MAVAQTDDQDSTKLLAHPLAVSIVTVHELTAARCEVEGRSQPQQDL